VKSAILLCSAAAVTLMTSPANADDGRIGFASTGSTTVTVIIPPLQAGFDASREGAVGLWTLTPGGTALMVKLPDTVKTGQSTDLDVFRAAGNVFDVTLPSGAGFHLAAATRTENKGLLRQSYVLSSDGPASRDQLQVMIRGI
jgi:hypothetical protein